MNEVLSRLNKNRKLFRDERFENCLNDNSSYFKENEVISEVRNVRGTTTLKYTRPQSAAPTLRSIPKPPNDKVRRKFNIETIYERKKSENNRKMINNR